MKNLVSIFLIFICFSAIAVEDYQPLSEVGRMKLKVKIDINIRKSFESTWLKNCYISTDTSDLDRVISKGTVLEVSKVALADPIVAGGNSKYITQLYIDNKKSLKKIVCRLPGDKGDYREMTVGEFKKDMSLYMNILIDPPVELE